MTGDVHKHDGGKTRWFLLPWKAVECIVAVMMFGANKYTAQGWKKVPNAEERYMDAAIRHLTAEMDGEVYDEESSLLHLAHAGCCILFLIWFKLQRYTAVQPAPTAPPQPPMM